MSSPTTFFRISLGLAFLVTSGLSQIVVPTSSAIAQNINSANTTAPLQVAQATTILFVAPNGSDTNTGLLANQPLRSLTAAIQKNPPIGTIIQIADGIYNESTGEQFPIKIPAGVTLRGNSSNQGKNVIISGGGRFISPTFARQNIAMLVGNGASIEGITLTNSNPRGYALWLESAQNITIANNTFTRSTHDGIFLTGSATADITSNIFLKNGANGISALGTSKGQIKSNTFYDTGYGLAIGTKSQVSVVSNRIINNRGGIVVSNLSTPTFRNNLIANNQENGIVILKDRKGQPTVDLGTATSLGENIFQNNKQFDINNDSGIKITAIGNQLDPKRTQGAIDLVLAKTPLATPITPEPIIPIEIKPINVKPTTPVTPIPIKTTPTQTTPATTTIPTTTTKPATTTTIPSPVPTLQRLTKPIPYKPR
jgi:parallel beta-helix repeat protein